MEARKEPWLINILPMELSSDKLEAYRHKSREKITQGNTVRVFDDFEFLLPHEELLQITKDYLTLLRNIHTFTDANDEIANLNSNQITFANNLLAKIIRIGIDELFDNTQQIRDELIELLNWKDLIDKVRAVDLLCAYVGSIFQLMYAKYPKSLTEHMLGRQCAEKYINHNYRDIIKKTLRETGYHLEDDSSEHTNIFKSPGGIAAIAATTITITSALVALSVYAYRTIRRNNSNGDSESDEVEKKSPAKKS